jgi:hypothetical protein
MIPRFSDAMALRRVGADLNTEAEFEAKKKDLLAPLLPGMIAPPHAMVPGATEQDYYSNKIKGASPEQTVVS